MCVWKGTPSYVNNWEHSCPQELAFCRIEEKSDAGSIRKTWDLGSMQWM